MVANTPNLEPVTILATLTLKTVAVAKTRDEGREAVAKQEENRRAAQVPTEEGFYRLPTHVLCQIRVGDCMSAHHTSAHELSTI